MNDFVDLLLTPFYGIVQTLLSPSVSVAGITFSFGAVAVVIFGVSLIFRLFTK